MVVRLFIFFLCLFSMNQAMAGEIEVSDLFIHGEVYKDDRLASVGFTATYNEYGVKTDFSASIVSSVTFAEIVENDDGNRHSEEFVAWEEALRGTYNLTYEIHIFSDVGIDFGELLFDGLSKDESVRIDYFFSLGIGYELEEFSFDVYVKQRSMDGLFLDKINRVYFGVGFSILF